MTDNERGDSSIVDSLTTVVSGGALVSASKVVSLGVGFLVQLAMARLLTSGQLGEVVFALAAINFAALLATLGMGQGLMRELPHHEDNPGKAQGVVRAGIVLGAIAGPAVAAGLFLLAPILDAHIFEGSMTTLLRVGALGVPCLVAVKVAVALARGARDARVHAYVNQLTQPTLRMLFITALLLLTSLGALGAVSGAVAAYLVSALVAVYLAARSIPSFDAPPVPMYRAVLLFSLPLLLANGMQFVNRQVDTFMIAYFLASDQLGIYNISLQLSNLMMAMHGTFGFLLAPMLTRLHESGRDDEMRRIFQLMTKWIVILSLPATIVLVFAPELAILPFGSEYTEGATALRILLMGKLFMIATGLYQQSLVGLGHNRLASMLVAMETVINVVLNFVLIPIYGFEGAAMAMSASTIVGNTIGAYLLYDLYDIQPFTSALAKLGLAVGALAGAGSAAALWFGLPLELVVVIVGVAYLPLVATVGLEPEDEMLFSRFEERLGYDLTPIRQAVQRLTFPNR